jgi:glycosyltransferase AcbS
MFRERPREYRRLSDNARRVARRYTWDWAVEQHVRMFELLDRGGAPRLSDADALRYHWFDRLSDEAWVRDRDAIAGAAAAVGDADTFARCADLDGPAMERLYGNAYARGDFVRCEQLAARAGRTDLTARLRARSWIVPSDGRWSVGYRLPHAAHIDVFLPSAGHPRDAGRYVRHPLARDDRGIFRCDLPGPAPARPDLVFLLTLASGRTVWDCRTITPMPSPPG